MKDRSTSVVVWSHAQCLAGLGANVGVALATACDYVWELHFLSSGYADEDSLLPDVGAEKTYVVIVQMFLKYQTGWLVKNPDL